MQESFSITDRHPKTMIGKLMAFMILCFALLCHAEQTAAKPNVIFILTDDMGWGDLGSFGNKEMATPNIDRLAKE
jgi:hypothetical protein